MDYASPGITEHQKTVPATVIGKEANQGTSAVQEQKALGSIP